MTENFSIPLKYKEGTFKAEEIRDFSGEAIDFEYHGCGEMYRYIVPKYEHEVYIYEVTDNPVFTATYDSNGVIKHIELHREDRTELVYIKFRDNEHAKENIWQYSCYWGDRISEKILERKEKIARLLIDYSDDWYQVEFLVNAYTPEDVRQTIDDYNKYIESDNYKKYIKSMGEKYRPTHDYPVEDISRNYRGYTSDSIEPDIMTLQLMLLCTNPDFADELYRFAVYVMTDRIKNNVLDKLNKTDDFKFIATEFSD